MNFFKKINQLTMQSDDDEKFNYQSNFCSNPIIQNSIKRYVVMMNGKQKDDCN